MKTLKLQMSGWCELDVNRVMFCHEDTGAEITGFDYCLLSEDEQSVYVLKSVADCLYNADEVEYDTIEWEIETAPPKWPQP